MADLISVIVASYNRPDALDACLRSLSQQSDQNFEVVVADDGSGVETADVIRDWSKRPGMPVKHAWHADMGFRLAEIRNRAIRISAGTYCVFLDGDCLARRDFVASHRRLMEPGWFVTGNRLLLSRDLTGRVLQQKLTPETWGPLAWFWRRCARDVNRLLPLMTLSLGPLRKRSRHKWRGARGSNMAFWRADLQAVDGFDGAFVGWGREDSDIFVRMIRHGIRRKDGRFATAVLHLWHQEADRARLPDNDRQLEALVAGTRVRAQQGLTQIVCEVEQFRGVPSNAP